LRVPRDRRSRFLLEIIDLVESFQHRRRLRAVEAIETNVIAAAFHVRGRETFRQNALEKRNVFLHQLFLEVFRAGGDDHAPVAAESGSNRRHEIGEGLAGTGAGFDDEVSLLLKRAHHGLRHLYLARSKFVFRMCLGY
jgi:hypothetical protein